MAKDDDGNKHEKPDPAAGDGQVLPGTPIDPSEPHDDGKHEK